MQVVVAFKAEGYFAKVELYSLHLCTSGQQGFGSALGEEDGAGALPGQHAHHLAVPGELQGADLRCTGCISLFRVVELKEPRPHLIPAPVARQLGLMLPGSGSKSTSPGVCGGRAWSNLRAARWQAGPKLLMLLRP